MTGPRTRTRRLFASAAAFALTVTGVAIAAPSAEAAPAPRKYTATLTTAPSPSGTVTAGVQADYSLLVTNSSTSISALDRVRVTIPAGFTVVTGTVSRTGWTQTVSGSTLTAKTSNGLFYGVPKGKSVTIKFKATAPAGCTSGSFAWPLSVDGVLLVFSTSSPTPSVTVNPVANSFAVASVLDRQDPPLDHQAVVGEPFDTTVTFLCGTTPAQAPATTLSLATTLGGPLTTEPMNVAAGAISASIEASYDQVQAGVPLTVSASALAPLAGESFAVDIVTAGVTADLDPGDVVTLEIAGATANLGNGATGVVTLISQPCSGQDVCPPGGTETTLTGNFKGPGGGLYGWGVEDSDKPLAPAEVVQICPATECQHEHHAVLETDTDPPNRDFGYNFNYLCPGYTCGYDYSGREVEEDFNDYPVFVSVFNGETYEPYTEAPRCVDLPTDEGLSEDDILTALTTVGEIQSADGQALGFCVDVNAITRVSDSFIGTLSLPVLFVEDPKFIVGR